MKIQIKESDLRSILQDVYQKTEGFWSGWGIPIYAKKDGTLYEGTWLNSSSWTEGGDPEIYRVPSWSISEVCSDEFTEEYTKKDAIWDHVYQSGMIDHAIEKIQGQIKDAEEMSYYHNYEIANIELV